VVYRPDRVVKGKLECGVWCGLAQLKRKRTKKGECRRELRRLSEVVGGSAVLEKKTSAGKEKKRRVHKRKSKELIGSGEAEGGALPFQPMNERKGQQKGKKPYSIV